MKRIHLFFAAAAAVLAFAACEPEETVGVPDIQVTPSSVSFQSGASSQTVTLTASRDWTVSGAPDWLAFDPSSGKASLSSQTVTITAIANPGYNRSADVTFTIGLMKAYVHVDQPGDKGVRDDGKGTLESPYTIAGVKAYIDGLENPSAESPQQVYVKGFVSSITEAYSAQFGNGTFYITDEDGTETFYVYRALYLENKKFTAKDTQIQVGDEVVICGNVYLFGSSNPVYETVTNKAFLYSLNGETKGYTQAEITASTVEDFIARADEGTYYRLTGIVSAFKTGTNSAGKDWMQFDLTDDTGSILVYGFNDGEFEKWAGVVKDRGTVTLTGTYQYYEKNKQHEVMNVTIESFEEASAPPEITASTVADFIAKADKNTYYRLTGTVSAFKTGTNSSGKNWMQFNLADDTGTILVYGFQDGEYDKWATTVKDGGTITLTGTYEYYEKNKQHEVMNASIESFKEGEPGPEPPGPSGEVKAVTIAEFNAAEESNSQVYELVGTIGGSINADYGNFDLTDETGTVYVYGLTSTNLGYGAKNDKSYATLGLNAGDKIKIRGYRGSFNGKIEVMYAWFIEKVGGDTPPGPSGEVKAVTIAEFNAAEESNSQVYELVGTIGGSINADYGNFDLTDETGTVYVYGLTATELGYGAKNDKSYASLGLKEGDKIKIRGYRGSFNGKIEVMYAWFIEKVSDGGQGGGETGDVKAVSIADFNAAEESETQVYELVGTIGGSINETYGNFDLTDETGTVYVYGLTSTNLGYGAKNDKSYASLGLKEGDKIKIRGYRGSHNGKIEVMYAWFIEKVSDGGQGGGGETSADFTSNVTWTSGSDGAYDEKANVNGTSDVAVLKLGTSSKVGTSTLTLPAGSTSLTFYAVSWKGKPSKIVFSVDGKEVGSVEPAANDGLANQNPYTLTVTESDKYTITFDATSTVKVETSGSNTRAALFGIQAK